MITFYAFGIGFGTLTNVLFFEKERFGFSTPSVTRISVPPVTRTSATSLVTRISVLPVTMTSATSLVARISTPPVTSFTKVTRTT